MKIKKQNGITLIALVITIIIMIILAAVVVAALTGDNGLITNAQKAINDTDVAEVKERIQLEIMAMQIEGTYTKEDVYNVAEYITGNCPIENETLGIVTVITEKGNEVDITDLLDGASEIDYSKMEGVAAIGHTSYESLQLAIDSVPEGELTTIYLLKDTSEDVVTLENQNIILNLRGYTISNESGTTFQTLSGTEVEITNGKIYNSSIDEHETLKVSNNSKIIISSDSEISKDGECWETIRSLWKFGIEWWENNIVGFKCDCRRQWF